MTTAKKTVDLMEEVAYHYGIDVEELKRRIRNGETLIHQYYKEVSNGH